LSEVGLRYSSLFLMEEYWKELCDDIEEESKKDSCMIATSKTMLV
jgi:hypothetical protein